MNAQGSTLGDLSCGDIWEGVRKRTREKASSVGALEEHVFYEKARRPMWLEPREQVRDRAISCRAACTMESVRFLLQNGRELSGDREVGAELRCISQDSPGACGDERRATGLEALNAREQSRRQVRKQVQNKCKRLMAQNSVVRAAGLTSNFAVLINSMNPWV